MLHDLLTNTNKYPKINIYLDNYFSRYPDDINVNVGKVVNDKEHMWSPLFLSCALCNNLTNIETIKTILKHKPNINYVNETGTSALLIACSMNVGSEAIELLCGTGINVDLQDDQGNTALHNVSRNRNDINFKIAQLLIKYGANIDLSNNNGCNALLFAIASHIEEVQKTPIFNMLISSEYLLNVVNYYIKSGANVNHVDINGLSSIYYAAVFGGFNVALIVELIKAGANLNLPDNKGFTALHKCLMLDVFKPSTIFTLMTKGAKINACRSCVMRTKYFKENIVKDSKCLICDTIKDITMAIKITTIKQKLETYNFCPDCVITPEIVCGVCNFCKNN